MLHQDIITNFKENFQPRVLEKNLPENKQAQYTHRRIMNQKQQSQRWIYSQTVQDHFFNPRNALVAGESFDADGIGEVGSPACGDMMQVLIKVDKTEDRITECRWKTFGCASAIASTSMLSVMLTEDGGMKIDNALRIRPQHILSRLGGLPDKKVHCSVLGDEALREAIKDYFQKSGQDSRIPAPPKTKVICHCRGVSDAEIEDAVLEGATTIELVQKKTTAGTGCGICIPEIEQEIQKTKDKYFQK